MEKTVAVKFDVKSNVVLIWLAGNLCSQIQDYQMTHTFVFPGLKLVARAAAKLLSKSENSNLLK